MKPIACCLMCYLCASGFRQFVRESQDDEFGRADCGHSYFDDQSAFENIQGCHGFAQTHRNVKRLFRFYALQCALRHSVVKKFSIIA